MFTRAGRWADEWWPQVLSIIGAIAFATWNTEGSDKVILPFGMRLRDLLLISGIVGTVVGTAAMAYRKGRFGSLREERDRLKQEIARQSADRKELAASIRRLCDLELGRLFVRLGYHSTERISLFLPTPTGFRLASRCSSMERYRLHSRDLYPLQEGCLGRAYDYGSAEEVALPSPSANLDEWLDEQESRWHVAPEAARAFVMKSRTYVALRLERELGRDPLGAIVFESELIPAPDGPLITLSGIRPIFDPESARLGALLELSRAVAGP